VGEYAVDNHGVEGNDGNGEADCEDGGHGDGDALMLCKGIVEGPVLEGEGLVEGLDLVDGHEDGEEDAATIRKEVVCDDAGRASSQDHDIVEDVTGPISRWCVPSASSKQRTTI
jgi:hypothetical protein